MRSDQPQRTVLMIAPTDTLSMDKRIVLTCNSLAAQGHEVVVLTPPQRTNAALPANLLHSRCTHVSLPPHDLPAFFRLNLGDWIPAQNYSSPFERFARRLQFFVSRKPYDIKTPWKRQVAFGIERTYWKGVVPLLWKLGLATETFFLFQIGPKRYSRFKDVMKLNTWSYWLYAKSLELSHERNSRGLAPFDLLYVHDLWSLPVGVILKELLGLPLVYDSHDIGSTIFSDPTLKSIAEKNEESLYRKTNRMLTVNRSVADYYRKRYPFLDPVVILNAPTAGTGESRGIFQELRKRTRLKDPLFGVCVNFFSCTYGFETYFEALRHTHEPVCLALIGSGPGYDQLEKLAAELGLLDHRVFFLGSVPFNQVTTSIADADFGIVPAKPNINFGLNSPSKLYEYIQAGLPIAAQSSPEIDQVVIGDQVGKILECRSPRELAQELDRFCVAVRSGEMRAHINAVKNKYVWPSNLSELALHGIG